MDFKGQMMEFGDYLERMKKTNKSPIDFLIKQKQKWGMIILDDLRQAKEMEKLKAFEIFKAGQDSMEEGGLGFEQFWEQTHGGNK